MAQEFTINSSTIESKINQLLPSQGGLGAGVDFSASTMVIPIVDLTESAEGSSQRQDLQTAISFTSATAVNVVNTTSTLISTTGFYKCQLTFNFNSGGQASLRLTDGVSSKNVIFFNALTVQGGNNFIEIVVYLKAGESLEGFSNSVNASIVGNTRQIADINGNLTSTF